MPPKGKKKGNNNNSNNQQQKIVKQNEEIMNKIQNQEPRDVITNVQKGQGKNSGSGSPKVSGKQQKGNENVQNVGTNNNANAVKGKQTGNNAGKGKNNTDGPGEKFVDSPVKQTGNNVTGAGKAKQTGNNATGTGKQTGNNAGKGKQGNNTEQKGNEVKGNKEPVKGKEPAKKTPAKGGKEPAKGGKEPAKGGKEPAKDKEPTKVKGGKAAVKQTPAKGKKPANGEEIPPPLAADSSPSGFWVKLFTRSIFGVAMILAFMAAIYVGHVPLMIFIMLGQVAGWREIMNVRYVAEKEKKIRYFRSLQWYFLFVTLFYLYLMPTLYWYKEFVPTEAFNAIIKYHKAISFSLYVIGFVSFILSLKKETIKYQFGQITWTLMTNFLFIGQTSFGISNLLQGLIWIVLPHSLIICNDIMAYFCGVTFGKKFIKRPLTKLSPNKTWEGAIGATFFTVIFGFFLAAPLAKYDWFICPRPSFGDLAVGCQPYYVFVPTTYEVPFLLQGLLGKTIELIPLQLHAIFFGLFASIVGPFGGLFASGIKRAYGKKDFDSFIPGHGGMIDRFDCQYLTLTFVYVYLSTFVASGVLKPEQLVHQFLQLQLDDQLRVFEQLRMALGK